MADRSFCAVPHMIGVRVRMVTVRATLNASANGTIVSNPGNLVASIVHDAAGKYVITFTDLYRKPLLMLPHYGIVEGQAVDLYASTSVQPTTVSGVMVAQVQLKTGAANTDPPASPNGGELQLLFIFEDSDAL